MDKDAQHVAAQLLRAVLTGDKKAQCAAFDDGVTDENISAVLGRLAGLSRDILQAAGVNLDAARQWLDAQMWELEAQR